MASSSEVAARSSVMAAAVRVAVTGKPSTSPAWPAMVWASSSSGPASS
ncbi:Uncharacterised protein [Mycobacteroides abscessus subsp. abscessus]|nr:Uncharacterised protein [Mycobacteroides abscessus subsp. abscessus]